MASNAKADLKPEASTHSSSSKDLGFVTVVVGKGQEKAKFTIHEQLLVKHSGFLGVARTIRSNESENKMVILEEENSGAFRLFVHWLYHQRWPHKSDGPVLAKLWDRKRQNGTHKMNVLIYLWVFCDKFKVPVLKRKAMTQLFDHFETFMCDLPSLEMVCYVYEKLHHESPLCLFLTHMYCSHAGEDVWEDADEAGWPPLFLKNVLGRYAAFADSAASRDCLPDTACEYHEHADYKERPPCEEAWQREMHEEIAREKWEEQQGL